MITALVLLLVALGIVLYRDRDFWFPDTQEADDQEQTVPTAASAQRTAPADNTGRPVEKKSRSRRRAKQDAPANPTTPPLTEISERTALPPLEVEVVAGDAHRMLHPGTNSVRVDLQPDSPQPDSPQRGSPPQGIFEKPDSTAETTASVTKAAERVDMSSDAAEVVSHPVKPGYPLLARQMKVQGSVILQALIGRDGRIQDLRVISGPPILATAAEEAVKQWHFKPHYLGSDAVETQAKITVNFTISTN